MAAFSHCHFHLPYLLDSSASGDQPFLNSTPTHHTSSNETLYTDTNNQSSTMTVLHSHEPSLTGTHSPADTSMAHTNKKKKRANNRNGSSKEGRTEGRNKKQKKSNSNSTGVVKEEERPKITQEPPTGYIHVRARRGEATDSHSLAERVRREKISERMRTLQGLVPGCDKITGKALVLDEIINYVQSLQNQVEFLLMKLASVNPMFEDFTMDQDTLMAPQVALPLPCVPQCSTNFSHDYSLLDDSVTVFLQGERSEAFSSQLDFVGELWDGIDQGQNFPNPCDFSANLWSFQS